MHCIVYKPISNAPYTNFGFGNRAASKQRSEFVVFRNHFISGIRFNKCELRILLFIVQILHTCSTYRNFLHLQNYMH